MKAPPRKTLPLWTMLYLASMGVLEGCPSHDETRKPDGEGPAQDETGQEAETEAPKPSV